MDKSKHILAWLVLFLALLIVWNPNGLAQQLTGSRIQPLQPSEWTDVDREILGDRVRNNDTIGVFKTCIKNEELCRVWLPFTSYIESTTSTLPNRDKQLLILRTAWLSRDGYVWSGHAPGLKRAGGTDEEVLRITKGPDAPGWSAFDAALLRAADELHNDQFIKDSTWKTLAEKYNDKQLLDLIFTVGQYTMVAMYLNSAGVQFEKGYSGLPK